LYPPRPRTYHATKYAVDALRDSLRLELRPLGIHVVMIEPGGIATEFPGVAGERLLETSGHGAYADYARRYAATLTSQAKGISSPSVVARAIARAATARRPRARYPVGRGAKAALAARWLLPDRAYDRVLTGVFTALANATTRGAGHP
jgi:NAD(P)-dependent dehydrogenase (short-subunit alcohol dehydrogenase family)